MPGNLSKYRGAGIPVGGMMMLPDSGARLVLADASEYIRTGTLWSASLYPRLAALDVAKAHVFGTTAVASTIFNSMANNGTSIFVGGVAAATTVHRSTNNGASFSPVSISAALNGVGNATKVAFGNGVFVAIAVSTGSIQIASSTDGNAWTNRLNHNLATTYTADRMDIFWTGTFFVALAGSGTAGRGVWYSANGTSWTEATHTLVIGTTGSLFGTGVDGKALINFNGSWATTTNSGVNWTAITAMSPVLTTVGRAGSNFVGFTAQNAPYYTATPETPTSWVLATAMPRQVAAPFLILRQEGTTRAVALYNNNFIAVSDDGTNWNIQYRNSLAAAAGAASWSATDFLWCATTANVWRAATTSPTAPNAVGSSIYAVNNNGSSTYDSAYYLRAK